MTLDIAIDWSYLGHELTLADNNSSMIYNLELKNPITVACYCKYILIREISDYNYLVFIVTLTHIN